MHLFVMVLVVSLGGAWILGALAMGCLQSRKTPLWKRCTRGVAAFCMALGACGFFGSALAATGGLNWLPESFEWPIGSASNVLVIKDEYYIVPHTPTGRIQVYDADLRFVRGWPVDAGGGTFQLVDGDEETFDVFTARGEHHYRFTVDGTQVFGTSYPPEEYAKLPDDGLSLTVPTRWWLWSFTNPFCSWLLAVCGLVILGLSDKQPRK